MARSQLLLFSALVAALIQPTPAPVPRCSPLILINKLAEASNILSDSNPYFPVPPCEYGGPIEALRHGDNEAVWILAHPELVPRHNFYEFIWLLKTGLPRWWRILTGKERLIFNRQVLAEGYDHYTPYTRTKAIGIGREREPVIIENKPLYTHVIKNQINSLIKNGHDKGPRSFFNEPPFHGGYGGQGGHPHHRQATVYHEQQHDPAHYESHTAYGRPNSQFFDRKDGQVSAAQPQQPAAAQQPQYQQQQQRQAHYQPQQQARSHHQGTFARRTLQPEKKSWIQKLLKL